MRRQRIILIALATTLLAFVVSQFGHVREWYLSLPYWKRIFYPSLAVAFVLIIIASFVL